MIIIGKFLQEPLQKKAIVVKEISSQALGMIEYKTIFGKKRAPAALYLPDHGRIAVGEAVTIIKKAEHIFYVATFKQM